MSLTQYNEFMSNMLNQKHALTKLRAELKGSKRKMYQCYKKLGTWPKTTGTKEEKGRGN